MPSNYNGRGGPKKSSDGKIADKFRGGCPNWKQKELDALVKQCKGDEEKISAKIMEWWEEGEPKGESEWEAVDRKSTKKSTEKKPSGGGARNDRGAKSSGGGGGERRGDRFNGNRGEGGRGVRDRGEGRGGRSSGRFGGDKRGGDRAAAQQKKAAAQPAPAATPAAPAAAPVPKQDPAVVDVPTPVTAAPAPKGAWGATSFANIAAAPAPKRAAPQPVPPPEPHQLEVSAVPLEQEQEQVTVDLTPEPVNMLSPEDPTPSGLPTPSALPPAAPTSGNVWGAKGGAHLIAAAKSKPISSQAPTIVEPEEPALVAVEVEEPIVEPEPEPEQDLIQESSFGVSLDSVLPASVNGANINASGWEPIIDAPESTKPSVEISHTSSLPEPEPVQVPLSQSAAPAAPTGVKQSNVLNMGHWETGDDNDGELDFGFGSFAPENDDVATETKTSQAPHSTTETAAAAPAAPQPSPARPPPGLSMPGIPAGATFVHELETKLENTTLAPKTEDKPAQETKTTQSQPQSFSNDLGGHMNSGMPQYGGMGMYGMPPGVPSALGNMPQFQNAPNLGGAVNQQQPKTETANQGQQQGPYGMMQSTPSTANTASGAAGNDNNNNNTSTNNSAAMPPGMPGMQYPNPAFMYGQYNHPYGMQYGYGQQFGQFGGYSQVMGQQGGYPYGAPSHHDDRNRGGNMRDNYQKGGRGGYRGNRNNNNQYGNNQYGNNYQGMGGGYGAAPSYNMGYGHGGGYGQPGAPSGMDHYGMQQAQGGFNQQNNDQNKGKPSGSDGGNQQFQQQSHLHQQPLGLQGSTNDSSNTGGSGWSSGPSAGGGQNWGGNWQRDN